MSSKASSVHDHLLIHLPSYMLESALGRKATVTTTDDILDDNKLLYQLPSERVRDCDDNALE